MPLSAWSRHLVVLTLLGMPLVVASEGPVELLRFGPGGLSPEQIPARGIEVTAVPGANALRLTPSATRGAYPGITVPAPDGHWDLSQAAYIALDLHNQDDHDIEVYVRIDNPGADGRHHCMTERIGVQPDQRVTFTIPLQRNNQSDIKLFGMQAYPQGLYQNGGIDPSRIVALTVFFHGSSAIGSFTLGNLRAGGSYVEPTWLQLSTNQFFPFIDRLGQFKHHRWPGKIDSVEDLHAQRDAEALALAQDPGPATWNQWGGWNAGPHLEASGHFRVEKVDGKWWLVDPDGRLFFSTGITCVGYNSADTPIEDREHWFEDLPPREGETAAFYTKHWRVHSGHYAGREPITFQYAKHNIFLKYGAQWQETYPELVHQRLRRWGINTIANWSDDRIIKHRQTPYTLTVWYDAPKLKNGSVNFPDPFHPRFKQSIDQTFARSLATRRDDPWLIGYFVDNEMPWGGAMTLAQHALASPASQSAKQAFVTRLQAAYADIADLNQAWDVDYADWDAVLQRSDVNPAKTPAGRADLEAFTTATAEAYFKTIREAIDAHGPDKLYLGCRSVGGAPNTARMAAKYCDVISYNRYTHSVRSIGLPDGIDAPLLIGEFHFGATDRGPFWAGLVSADNQEDRARKYGEFVRSALDNPLMVGVHWFQYGDQAPTARADGENGQIGFVDICDTPYPELTTVAREVGASMYDYRHATASGE